MKQDGTIISKRLPCWQDAWLEKQEKKVVDGTENVVEEAEVHVSLVVPAYNEEDRLSMMLDEAVEFLEAEYPAGEEAARSSTNGTVRKRKPIAQALVNGDDSSPNTTTTTTQTSSNHTTSTTTRATKGWEIIVVSDGSTDSTINVALDHARKCKDLSGSIRVVALASNRGKGGAVTHGMRHVRGQYVGFADADGASKFADISKLIKATQDASDSQGRAFAVGSRAHLVGSETVVKRSKLRNFLMHSFHLLLRLLTPPATSRIRDTQCGFKLFSRAALPYIVPHMHSEGWIFDVEMLMLAERAKIPMVEVPIGWHEVKGSKLNVVWDSLGMAWGLAILRLAWMIGVYQT